jgi:Domain of unknown function (DUF5348)
MKTTVAEFYLREYGDRWGFDGWELHCGDCFQVEDPTTSTWLDVRIEIAAGQWYLVGLSPHLQQRQLGNFKARRYP